nr:hypothetical protein [Saprospiraceae bacterium]
HNHVHLSYELTDVENGVLLTIIQGDFAPADKGRQRYEESAMGWKEIVIPKMKEVIANEQ